MFAFDPTPRSVEYMKTEAAQNPHLRFFPLGLWHRKETLKFFAPEDPGHVSHSVVNLQNTSDYFEAPCDRLSSIMSDLGHSRIDMLKLNIEGAQYAVLDSIIEDKVPIGVLSVAFDQPASPLRIYRTVRALQRHGFDLVKVDRWAYTFVADS